MSGRCPLGCTISSLSLANATWQALAEYKNRGDADGVGRFRCQALRLIGLNRALDRLSVQPGTDPVVMPAQKSTGRCQRGRKGVPLTDLISKAERHERSSGNALLRALPAPYHYAGHADQNAGECDQSQTCHGSDRLEDDLSDTTELSLTERAAELGLLPTRAFVLGKASKSPDALRKARSRKKQREDGFVELNLKTRDEPSTLALLKKIALAAPELETLVAVDRVMTRDLDRQLVLQLRDVDAGDRELLIQSVIDLIRGLLAKTDYAVAMMELKHHPELVRQLISLQQRRERGSHATSLGERLRDSFRRLLSRS